MSSFLDPMLLSSGEPSSLTRWIAEPKLDGWRVQVKIDAGAPKVTSRGGVRLTVPELDGCTSTTPVRLDGELVVMAGAVGDFRALSPRMFAGFDHSSWRAAFVAFDLLELDGRDLTTEPWHRRRQLLEKIIPDMNHHAVALMPYFDTPTDAWDAAVDGAWEGVVYKRRGSLWRAGTRSPDWRKRKVWRVNTFSIASAHMDRCGIDAISVRNVDGARSVIDMVGVRLELRLHGQLGVPDRRGWHPVDGLVEVDVQHRRGPSGDIREPRIVGVR